MDDYKAVTYTDNTQGFPQKSHFSRSPASSVLPSARLTGLLGRSSGISGGLVLLKELRMRGHVRLGNCCPLVPSPLRHSGILAAFQAHHHHPPPGSSVLAETWSPCPMHLFISTATALTSRSVALENSVWSYSLSSVSHPLSQCLKGISTTISCQNNKNREEFSTSNLVNQSAFSALTDSTNPSP